jgi:CRISPR system Cascade subunit CasA
MFNLLTQPFIEARPLGRLTLPVVLAALVRDEVDSFPALRPHQGMFWHMFLVHLAGLSLHGAGRSDIPADEASWLGLLRALTPGFSDDEPWWLVVDDWSKPAFLQPPVPAGVELKNGVPTPDALDLLITSRNHDLKQAIARHGEAQDWIFALVSLQTGEGYGGKGNQGIARMNGGSSSRPMITLAPSPEPGQAPRPGAWFLRDLSILLTSPKARDHGDFPEVRGLGLVWLAGWPEGAQLRTQELDPWFIEVCRRVRLTWNNGCLRAARGTSEATRIAAKEAKGNIGDPWAPIHKMEGKGFTLGDEGVFNIGKVVELLLSGDWELPLLAKPARHEAENTAQTLVLQALARGNSKTGGFRSRLLPLPRSASAVLSSPEGQQSLHAMARQQIDELKVFDKALGYALVLAIAGGDADRIKRESYVHAGSARAMLDRFADAIFFEHLWRRHGATRDDAQAVERKAFRRRLWERTQVVFDEALPAMPCGSLRRPKAETAARGALAGIVMKNFGSDLTNERTKADEITA